MSACCHEYPNCIHTGNADKANVFGGSEKPKSKASSFDDFIVPDDKITAVTDYYKTLRKKFVHMKQERIIRKVVEHFHLKKGAEA